jgi:GNAT superfamily N-acetyltransferase
VSRGLKQLGPLSREEAYRFCEREPERCSYIAGWIAEGGLTRSPLVPRAWLLAEMDHGHIEGLVYISSTGIVMPVLESDEALDGVLEMARANPNAMRVLVGERRQVAALWSRLQTLGLSARMSRDQLGYSVNKREFRPDTSPLSLQLATLTHIDRVVEASAAMAREEAHDDPQARNPELFKTRIEERLARGRDFIYCEDGALLFKTNVAALSQLGGQIEGIYTMPEHRRRRIGRRGTTSVTAWVLERSDRAVLLVNEDNQPARDLYEQLGYRCVLESRTIFVAP